MKDQRLHFLVKCLQIIFIFSLLVVVLQVYMYYALPGVVDKYTQKYTQQTVEIAVEKTASRMASQIEQKLSESIVSNMGENNLLLMDSISKILSENAMNTSREPITVQGKIDKYFVHLLELDLPGQPKVVMEDTKDVVIFEFLDYQCGFCKRFYGAIKATKETHENLQVQYIDYPILGNMSILSATLALALSEQGLYYDMHNVLMQYSGRLTPQTLEQIGESIGIDKKTLEQSLKNTKYTDAIRNNLQMGKTFGVKGTPYSLVVSLNKDGKVVGEEINGYVSAETLSKVVEKYTHD